MSAWRRLLRRSGRVAWVTGIAGCAVSLLAPAALAATGIDITRESDGSAVSSSTPVSGNDVLRVVGHVPALAPRTDLVVRQPGDARSYTVATANTTTSGTDLTWDLDTSCTSFGDAPCAPALNGEWTVALTGGASATRSFTLRIPPAVVQAVAAVADGRTVTVSWQPGAEPDLRAYDVLTSTDVPVLTGIDPGKACGSGSCAATFDLGSGGSHAFVVRAERGTCPGCAATIASADSQPAAVTTHEPSGQPSGGTAGGSSAASRRTGSSTSGSSATTSAGTSPRSFDQTFRSYVPGAVVLGAPDLPAVRTEAAPLPDGSYKPTLAYPDRAADEDARAAHKPLTAAFSDDVAKIAENRLLWRSVAAACLMFLLAGHLRAWASGAEERP